MLAPRNTTNIGETLRTPLTTPDCQTQTRLASAVLNVEGSPENLHCMGGVKAALPDDEIPPPVRDISRDAFRPEFTNQADLDQRWKALKEYLTNATLQEQDILDVLESGILQSDTGKAVSGLFEGAVMRSIRARGTLSEARLKTIVDALCHLPPGQWQAALGEQARFSSDHRADGVMAFIQSRLDVSSAERDEKIAQKLWVSDAQWDALKEITLNVGQYARPGNKALHSAVQMLKDDHDVRPSLKDAQQHLKGVMEALRESLPGERKRWDDSLIDKVDAVYDQLKPGYQGATIRPEAVKQDELISLRFYNTPKPLSSGEPAPTLLENLQGFERHANFYTNVNTVGTRIPEGFFARFLYACNVLDTVDALRLDASHITTKPALPPSSDAWKNGANDFARSPFTPASEQPETAAPQDPLASLGRFFAQVDEILDQVARNVLPWDSAHAKELDELKSLCETSPNPYKPITTGLSSCSPSHYLPDIEIVREQLAGWLSRMSGSLLSTGAAVSGRAGDLIEQHPGKTAGAFAAYMAVSNFYASWFLPEPEDAVDPLQGIEIHPDPAPDESAVAQEYAIEGIEDLFEIFPDFADEVKRLVSQSDYPDPADDPQLVENLEALLLQPVPGHSNVTYQDYLEEISVYAELEAHEAFEDDPVSESPTEPADTSQAESILSDSATHVIKKRGLSEEEGRRSDIQTSKPFGATLVLANMLVQAGQRSVDADNSIGPDEEIAPGVTITQAADLFINDFSEMQTVLDSSMFILSSVEQLVGSSDLPVGLKSAVTYNTSFTVDYVATASFEEQRNGIFYKNTGSKTFTLVELVTGQHKRIERPNERSNIHWPRGYTDTFKNAVKNSDLSRDHKVRLRSVFAKSHSYELWKESFEFRLNKLVSNCRNDSNISESGKKVAEQYLNGEVRVRPVSIKQGRWSDTFHVSNAVFLSSKWKGPEGLFVFLGGNETVIESPVELFENGGKSIEEFPQLRSELSKRIHLKGLLGRDEDDFKYSQGRSSFCYGSGSKWSYTPIIFGRRDGPTRYGENHDAFKELFNQVINKVEADMDTSTSTGTERFVDALLEVMANFLTLCAIMLGIPGAPTAGLAFLAGAGAAAAKDLRGQLSDNPIESNRLRAEAIMGLVTVIGARYIGQALGKTFNTATEFRLTLKIYQQLKFTQSLSKDITDFLPDYEHHPSPLLVRADQIARWIAPRVKTPSHTEEKLARKFTSKRVAARLKSLGRKGPEVAQKLMDRTRVLYFSGPKEGYVYRGFAMCGDLRTPQEVFAHGLKTNGPVKNIQDFNGMNANSGVNGGVQASGYYDNNGMGAFHEGGKKGGYTYLIDGREMDGYDVARNRNWQADSGSRAGSNPYRIAYAHDIPGEKILGAYDSAGKFIPNQGALNRAIGKSLPDASPAQIPLPLKPLGQVKYATQAPL